jgi:transcriptional regulator with GAF, ATPase, and Fis domain
MAELQREARLGRLAVELVNTLTTDFDLTALLDKLLGECKELLDISEAGLVLSDTAGALRVAAATTDPAGHLEALQLQAQEGPAIKAFRTQEVVVVIDVADSAEWPTFRDVALREGYRAVHAIPLKVAETSLGAMCLFSRSPGDLNETDAHAGQALADLASLGILHNRLHSQNELVVAQLQTALDSRVVIEQAKGMIATANGVSVDEAFGLLRRYARNKSLRLRVVAESIVDSSLTLTLNDA